MTLLEWGLQILLLAMLAAASLAMSARIFALPLFDTPEGKWLVGLALRIAPVLIEFAVITAIYRLVPHHTVQMRHAVAGSLNSTRPKITAPSAPMPVQMP